MNPAALLEKWYRRSTYSQDTWKLDQHYINNLTLKFLLQIIVLTAY